MRILMAGDTHGDTVWVEKLCRYAHKRDCDRVFILGDFGYWEHTSAGARYLNSVSNIAVQLGVDVYFLDGNHENHPMLWEKYPPGPTGFCRVRSHLYYAPRGHRWEWDGVSFMSLGGAYSIDKKWRLEEEAFLGERTMYWPTEMITDEDVERSTAGGPVDVLLSHDCPIEIRLRSIKNGIYSSEENRRQLSRVVRRVVPKLVLHGHYHMRNSDVMGVALPPLPDDKTLQWQEVRVEGYDCNLDRSQDAWGVLDTDAVKRL